MQVPLQLDLRWSAGKERFRHRMSEPRRPARPSGNRMKPTRISGRLIGLIAIASCLALLSCRRADGGGSLLFHLSPVRVADVSEAGRLTDGAVSAEGDHWETDRTSVFRQPSSEADWD